MRQQRLDYEGFSGHRPRGLCRMTVWRPAVVAGETTTAVYAGVVVVTELEENPGPSVTNCIEHVAEAVERKLGEPVGDGWLLVEHYPHGDRGPDFWSLAEVSLDRDALGCYGKPEWAPIGLRDLAAAVGRPVDEIVETLS